MTTESERLDDLMAKSHKAPPERTGTPIAIGVLVVILVAVFIFAVH